VSEKMLFDINKNILKEFEEGLNTLNPEKSKIPARIIGYGEISTVFIIEHPSFHSLVFKRIPVFSSREEAEYYDGILQEYLQILKDDVGIDVAQSQGVIVETSDGRIVYYIAQELIPKSNIANSFITSVDDKDKTNVFKQAVIEILKVKTFNDRSSKIKVGIDGQISNWAVKNSSGNIHSGNIQLTYIDVSTPLYRKDGKEMLPAELFLKSTPPIIRGILKLAFLKEVLDRYYDFKSILIDLVANLFKEGLIDFVPKAVDIVNAFLDDKISFEQVKSYYKRDAFIWSLFQSMRRTHRFFRTKIMRKRYEFILPGKIKR
jgi:hypothetical protein